MKAPKETKQQKQGLALGLLLLGIIVLANICIFQLDSNNNPTVMIWTGIYLYFIGSIFLAAYYFEKESFIFRWAIWVCVNFSAPKGRKMAFFYFGLSILVGSAAILDSITK